MQRRRVPVAAAIHCSFILPLCCLACMWLLQRPSLLCRLSMQVYSRTLASGSERATVFAWAVVNAMFKPSGGCGDDDDDDDDIGQIHRSSDALVTSLEFQREIFQHRHNQSLSIQLLSDVLFADMYPRDCANIDWDIIGIRSSSAASSARSVCDALFVTMEAAVWTHGVVLTARGKHSQTVAGVNVDASSWVKSTAYRRVSALRPRLQSSP